MNIAFIVQLLFCKIDLPECMTNKNIEATCRRVRRKRSKYVVGVIEGLTKFIQCVQVVIASHT